MAGKRGSRRHSTTSFNESVVVAETSYQMLEAATFCNRERPLPPSITTKVLKYNEEFRGVYFLTIREKTLNEISYS